MRMRAGVAAALLALVLAAPARAVNHLIVIEEVLGSWQGDEAVQFVELRLLAGGQGSLSNAGGARAGTGLVFLGANGAADTKRVFSFTRDLLHPEAGAHVLIATTALAGLTGLTPDFVLPAGMLAARDGLVCYGLNPEGSFEPYDCVAYGKFAGETGRFGKPTPYTPDNRSLARVGTSGVTISDWTASLTPTPQANDSSGAALQTLCGDGVISQGEACDGTALGGNTCESLGFAKGTIACVQCHLDTHECTSCGNDAINAKEECDGIDLGGRTCSALGFTGGELDCTDRCKLSTRNCDPTFFVPGGGPVGPECLAAWRIANPTARPGPSGKAPVRQRCKDGDSGCDADVVAGTCTFTIAVCFDRDDARLARGGRPCRRASIESFAVLAPAEGDPIAAALAAAAGALGSSTVSGGVVTYGVPLDGTERCTEPLAIPVATRGARPGVLVLKTRTTASGGHPRDVDTLKLVCTP
jgi:hypothetical protein